ncbi:MAG TPA: amidohydrolase family protein, partial [bacterium]
DDYILPGMFDLHAHYNVQLLEKRREEFEVVPIVYLANGVTSTFTAGEYDADGMLELKKQIQRGDKIGPRIFNTGPYFGPARPGWSDDMTAEEIFKDVDEWAERGVAGFKAKRISRQHLKALIARAHLHGLTVTGHLDSGYNNTVNPLDAIIMGIDRVEHFLGGDALPPSRPAYASLVNVQTNSPEFREIVQLYLQRHVYFDATITAYGYFGARTEGYDYWTDEQSYFTPFVREHLQQKSPKKYIEQFDKIYWVNRKSIKAFYDSGGGELITLGTDHPSNGEFIAGFSAHRELEVLVRSGIPPAGAIKIATINGARALNVGEKLGSITVGKFADLFVVKGDPLQDITNTRKVHLVMKSGQVYYTNALLKSVEGKLGPTGVKDAIAW